ncbi:MAG TPA: universal stress protein [Cyanobacteria bacterium UBA11369]|nr:universal stress protein [Cyanobacteria bacterium UBA11371]HBE30447.1 universal stress protein [Cyanobacteria bacterium UBA11368]HBE49427.1 universal stress protein [Cyanobacteria bacterium UBA11369]
MFQKILVAMDSDSSQQVFDSALTLGKAMNSQLMLLHVLTPVEESSPRIAGAFSGLEFYPDIAPEVSEEMLMSYRKQWDQFETQCLEMLRSHTAQANTAGVTAEFTQNVGNPGKTICAIARTWGADLIILGRRGLSGLSELLLGSVSNYVLHHAPCSVLTVQTVKTTTEQSKIEESNVSY